MSTAKKVVEDVVEAAVSGAEPVDLAAELSALRAEMSAIIAHLGRVGGAGAEKMGQAARDGLAAIPGATTAGDARDALSAEWAAIERRVLTETGARPWRMLGVAALSGLVLGLILRR